MLGVKPHDAVAKVLGPLEAEIMRAMWHTRSAMTVREVLDLLNDERDPPLAYTTVMTVMARLAEKDILHRERDGRGYRYRAAVSDEASIAVRSVVRDFGAAAIAQFVDEARADPKMLRRLRRLLKEES